MKKVIVSVIVFLVLFTSVYQTSSSSVGTSNPKQGKSESTITASKYPGIDIETQIAEYVEYQYTVHFPRLKSEVWNEKMGHWVRERIKEFRMETKDLRMPDESWSYELHLDFEIYDVSDAFLSVKFTESKFLGGAHPIETITSYNFNREKEQFVALSHLFKKDSNYLEKLSELSYEKLMADPNIKKHTSEEQMISGLEPIDKNFQHFSIQEGKLVLFFERYQVGPNTIGSPEIQLTEEELANILKEEYLTSPPVEKVEEEAEEEITDETENEEATEPDPAPDKKVVALTFDDGPHPLVTANILDQLAVYNIQATFFVLGNRVEFYPDILKRMKEEGHEIGNHSWSHPQLTNLSREEIEAQLAKTDEQISTITGEPVTLVRPPYGAINDVILQYIDRPIINWSVDTRDWESRNPDAVLEKVKEQVYDGSIILMHDIYPSTAEALGKVLEWLDSEGYQVVTVSELLGFNSVPESAQSGKIYTSQKK